MSKVENLNDLLKGFDEVSRGASSSRNIKSENPLFEFFCAIGGDGVKNGHLKNLSSTLLKILQTDNDIQYYQYQNVNQEGLRFFSAEIYYKETVRDPSFTSGRQIQSLSHIFLFASSGVLEIQKRKFPVFFKDSYLAKRSKKRALEEDRGYSMKNAGFFADISVATMVAVQMNEILKTRKESKVPVLVPYNHDSFFIGLTIKMPETYFEHDINIIKKGSLRSILERRESIEEVTSVVNSNIGLVLATYIGFENIEKVPEQLKLLERFDNFLTEHLINDARTPFIDFLQHYTLGDRANISTEDVDYLNSMQRGIRSIILDRKNLDWHDCASSMIAGRSGARYDGIGFDL